MPPANPPANPQPDKVLLSPARLEAFSDGVIAVVITIMVLELKVPHENGLAGLQAILPILLVYALSFAFIGIYWVNHHLLLHRVETVDPRTLYTNLLFLFSLSLLPFFTAWLIEKERTPFSVELYVASLMASGITFLFLRLAVERRLRLAGSHLPSDRVTERKHWTSIALYLLALALAHLSPLTALLLAAAVNILWILPELGTRRRGPDHRPKPRPQAQSHDR